MTHAESQDLLLDLALGELDPARAAEVEGHLAGCDECRKEKAALEEARRLAGPLRELEEPPPGFDDRILQAARAQAQLDHDGNVGQVIEVAGNVRPLGVEASRIDAHGPVKVRPPERRRPRWMVRAALGGSVALAAALALVVSTTLETRRSAEQASRAQGENYRIRVQPAAPEAVETALRDAEANRDGARAPAKEEAPAAALPAPEGQPAAAPSPPPAAHEKKQDRLAQLRTPPPGAAAEGAGTAKAAGKLSVPSAGAKPAEPSAAPSGERANEADSARMRTETGIGGAAQRDDDAAARRPASAQPAPQAAAKAKTGGLKGAAFGEDVTAIEAKAQRARHAGDYTGAASLYRAAADVRRQANEPDAAAWNLAHAVECLAAVGQFDEARRVHEELGRLYPAETTAITAARRALREVDAPGAVPAKQ